MEDVIVIFDLDGTLIDTIGDLSAAVEHALKEGGYPGHSVEEYRKMVGHGIRNLVTRALPEGSSETVIDETLKCFVEYYTSHIDVLSRPYSGIPGLLEDLAASGVKLAVASNKFQAGTEALIRRFFPDISFVKILGNAPGLPLKPDPEVVRLALEAAGFEATGADAVKPDLTVSGSPPDLGRVHSRVALRLRSGLAAAEYGRWPVAQPEATDDEPEMREALPDTGSGEAMSHQGSLDGALPHRGESAVMVGDSATDIKTARNAGIPAVAVSWGFRPREDLQSADAIADTPEQLKDIIRIFTAKNI